MDKIRVKLYPEFAIILAFLLLTLLDSRIEDVGTLAFDLYGKYYVESK